MALVDLGWQLSVSVVDNGGNTSTLTYDLRAADYATAVTQTATVIANLNAITDSVISSYRLASVFGEDAFAYPAAGVENENKASLTLLLTGAGQKKANVKVPAPIIGIFTAAAGAGANVVDVSNAVLLNYTDMFQAAGECFISDGEDADSLVSGKRISAKNNNG